MSKVLAPQFRLGGFFIGYLFIYVTQQRRVIMGKKARRLRSPKYARKAAAFRNTVARLNNKNNNATPDNTNNTNNNNNNNAKDNVVTIPNALKTLNETTGENTTEKNTTNTTKNTTRKNNTTKRTKRTRNKRNTKSTAKTANG